MQYSKYENFSTNSAASETTNAMDKLDDAGKTDDGRKEEFKIIGGMDMDSDNDNERYGDQPINDYSFDDSIDQYQNRITNATSPQELSSIITELEMQLQLYQNSLTETQRIYNTLPQGYLKNTIFTSMLDTNNNITILNNFIRQSNLRISILQSNNKGTKRKYDTMNKGMGGKKKSKSQKKRKNNRKTKKTDINYTYTLYMLPNKEIIEIIEYDNKNKKNIKNNYNDMQDMNEYYNALTKIDNIPCNKNELHPKRLIKK